MRLDKKEIESIKESFIEVFEKGSIYLFGSRVDDTQKGGDIDLYIISPNTNLQKKIEFLVNLKKRVGDQKIDVILSRDKERVIEQEALSKGIKLCEI